MVNRLRMVLAILVIIIGIAIGIFIIPSIKMAIEIQTKYQNEIIDSIK